MIEIILGAIVPVLLVASIGYAWTRAGRAFDSTALTLLVTEIGTPFLVFSTFAKAAIPPGAFAASALATIAILAAFVIAAALVLRVLRLPWRTFLPALSFPNTGNLGLPLALYAFGPEGLSYAIVFYTVCSLANFSVGQAIAAGTVDWRTLLRMPILYGAALGVAVSVLGLELPRWLANTVSLLGSITVPLMLLMLGMSLGRLRVATFPRALMLAALRIGMGAAIAYAVTTLFGLEGVAKNVLIQQGAMPVAVFNYLFALRWNNQPEEIAGLVVVSTLLAVVTTPALLYLLLG